MRLLADLSVADEITDDSSILIRPSCMALFKVSYFTPIFEATSLLLKLTESNSSAFFSLSSVRTFDFLSPLPLLLKNASLPCAAYFSQLRMTLLFETLNTLIMSALRQVPLRMKEDVIILKNLVSAAACVATGKDPCCEMFLIKKVSFLISSSNYWIF